MPIYEYLCAGCGGKFERLVMRRDDRAEVSCPRCGHVAEQVFSTFAISAGGGIGVGTAGSAACSVSPSGRFT